MTGRRYPLPAAVVEVLYIDADERQRKVRYLLSPDPLPEGIHKHHPVDPRDEWWQASRFEGEAHDSEDPPTWIPGVPPGPGQPDAFAVAMAIIGVETRRDRSPETRRRLRWLADRLTGLADEPER